MIRLCLVLCVAAVWSRGQVNDAGPARSGAVLKEQLGFEAEPKGNLPGGWGGNPSATLFVDEAMPRTGRRSGKIERTADSPAEFSSLTKSLPIDFSGKTIELRGFLRSEDVSNYFGFWLREDGAAADLEFASMQPRQLRGTTDWTEYSLTLPLREEARTLFFGFLVSGAGRAWADDLQLLVDGKPIWEAPKVVRVPTVLESDQEFAAGSKIALTEITTVQQANLAKLAQVWGFLKYHHPKVTSGQLQWDFELFRVMPAILGATDSAAANAVLSRWIDGMGELKLDGTPATLEEAELHLKPGQQWIEDEARLGTELSGKLRAVHAARPKAAEQFYVTFARGVGNPMFEHELNYPKIKAPDAGYQLLGLFRFWNIIRYWFPYRDLIGEGWNGVLTEFIPRVGLAANHDAYQLEMMALIARVKDTHANLWSSLPVRPPVGNSQLPVTVRFVEGQAVVTDVLGTKEAAPPVFERGDLITALDGVPLGKLIEQWSPYYAASNEPTRLRDIARSLPRGPAGPVKVTVKRGGQEKEIDAVRVPFASLVNRSQRTRDLPGPVFQRLSQDVAYLKLSGVKAADAAKYISDAAGTKGLVIDIRNYPSEFMVFVLGSHLVDKLTHFARFTRGDASNPGAFHFTPPLALQPREPFYAGKVVILVDEVSQSQAEYTTMAFRVAPKAVVVGSTTAGADGNVMPIPLPGGLRTMMSGIGVFYPDKRPTQRVGIIADVEAKPTLVGIREGRDEVLEEGLRQILGPEYPAAELRKLVPTAAPISPSEN